MKFSIKDFSSKCDQIRSKLRIWSHLLKKFFMKNFIFCAVWEILTILKDKFRAPSKIYDVRKKTPSQMFERFLNTPLIHVIIFNLFKELINQHSSRRKYNRKC